MTRQDYVVADGPDGRTLLVTGAWSRAAAEELSTSGINLLELNSAHGFQGHDLEFLGAWPLKRLHILARTISDVEPIFRLRDSLEDLKLICAPSASALDLTFLPNLRKLSVENWLQVKETLHGAAHLRRLSIVGYTDTDLVPLAGNGELREVSIKQAPRLRTLLGVERLPQIEDLLVAGARRLEDLTSLTGNLPNLTSLRFNTCGGIASLASLQDRHGLRELWVANCGPLASLGPLSGMETLNLLYLYESTRITDGDLAPLLTLSGLDDFRMMNRAHYKPTVAAVKKALRLAP